MPPIPEKYHLDRVAVLNGDGVVSYPYDTTHRRVERIFTVPRGTPSEAFGVKSDDEYTATTLVEQRVIGGDQNNVVIYQAYEDLPGPWIPGTRYDDDLGPVQTRQRAILTSTATPATESATGKTTYQARGNSGLVSWQIEEAWSDGTGSTGNPAYPINIRDYWDNEQGDVRQTTQVVVASVGNHGSVAVVDNVATEISYESYPNSSLQKKVTKTFALPGPLLTRYDDDSESGMNITISTQIIAKPANATGYGSVTGVITEYRPINSAWGTKVITTHPNGVTAGRVEFQIRAYTYPSLIFTATGSLVEATDGTARVQIAWTRRAARSRQVTHRITTYWGLRPTLVALASGPIFDPELQNLIYDGIFINVNERNVLNDHIGPLTYTTGTDNPKWPAIVETVEFPASPLSATAYLALVGQYKMVNYTLEDWKYDLWRLRVIEVPIL